MLGRRRARLGRANQVLRPPDKGTASPKPRPGPKAQRGGASSADRNLRARRRRVARAARPNPLAQRKARANTARRKNEEGTASPASRRSRTREKHSRSSERHKGNGGGNEGRAGEHPKENGGGGKSPAGEHPKENGGESKVPAGESKQPPKAPAPVAEAHAAAVSSAPTQAHRGARDADRHHTAGRRERPGACNDRPLAPRRTATGAGSRRGPRSPRGREGTPALGRDTCGAGTHSSYARARRRRWTLGRRATASHRW